MKLLVAMILLLPSICMAVLPYEKPVIEIIGKKVVVTCDNHEYMHDFTTNIDELDLWIHKVCSSLNKEPK